MSDPEQQKIQQKIKKLMKQKKTQKEKQITKKTNCQSSTQTHFKNQLDSINNQQQISNRTEWNKRSRNYSQKSSQYNYSVATAQTNKSVQVVQLIKNIFQHSKKLNLFLSESQIKKQEALQFLIGNQLVMLSLNSKISKLQKSSIIQTSKQELSKIIEGELFLKIKKMKQRSRQIANCQNIQTKLKKLIQCRLQSLKKY